MSLRGVPEGAVVEQTYYSIPQHYTVGERFPVTNEGWDAVVIAARAKKAALVESLAKSLGAFSTPEQIEETANVQVRIDLRWKMVYPQGGGMDTVVESFKDIDRLRTLAEIGAKV